MPNGSYLNFDLLITRFGDAYRAYVIDAPGGDADTTFSLPFSPQTIVRLVHDSGMSRGLRLINAKANPAPPELRELGSRLYDAVFQGGVRSVLVASQREAKGSGSDLRIRLRFSDDAVDLAALPWEILFDPEQQHFLALSESLPILRYLSLPRPRPALIVKPPLAILAVLASPTDQVALNVEQEWQVIQTALADLCADKKVTLEGLETPTFDALHQRLLGEPIHVLHFVGHGVYDAERGQGQLLFEDTRRESHWVPAKALAMLLHNHSPLRLIYLNACEGAIADQKNAFSGLAQTLVQQGVPAAVAMQDEITDAAAIELARIFYAALATGRPVDAALTQARVALAANGNDEWIIPVLFSRSPDNRLFDVVDVLPAPDCPYPGMVPFTEQQTDLFFGRTREIEEAVERLRLHPFLTIIGPSGSGKSSLVYAGILPALRAAKRFGTGAWAVKIMRPGTRPASTLAHLLGDSPDVLTSLSYQERTLLFVDQFEELFTLSAEETSHSAADAQGINEAQRFLDALIALSGQPNLYILLTVRADFYPDLMASPLWPSVKAHRLELTPLGEDELWTVIVEPAAQVGVTVDDALAVRLIADAAGQAGVLPLVQETLVLLWEKVTRRALNLQAYQGMAQGNRSGIQVAISRRADVVYQTLPNDAQPIARRIFLRLIQFGEGRADTRRQQTVQELQASGDDPLRFAQTLGQLTDSRLLTTSGDEDGPARLVDIAHEALIAGWPTLGHWIAQRREAEQIRRRLEAKAQEWVRLGRASGGLLDNDELSEARRWLDSPDAADIGYSANLSTLVHASEVAIESARQRETQQQYELAQQQARVTEKEQARRRLFRLAWVLALLTLAAISAGVVAFGQRQLALQARNSAETARVEAVSAQETAEAAEVLAKEETARADTEASAAKAARAEAEQLRDQIRIDQMAQTALNVSEKFPQRGLLLAVEALQLQTVRGQAQLPSAEQSLRDLLTKIGGTSLAKLPQPAYEVGYSSNGQRIVTYGEYGDLTILDSQTGQVILAVPDYGPVSSAGPWLVYATDAENDGRTVFVANLEEAAFEPRVLHQLSVKPDRLAISRDGTWSAIVVTEPKSGQSILELRTRAKQDAAPVPLARDQGSIGALAFSLNAKWLAAAGSGDGSNAIVRLWNMAHPTQEPLILDANPDTIQALTFSWDSNRLISVSEDQTFIWQLGRPLEPPRILENACCFSNTVEVSQDDRWIAVSGKTALRLWQLDDPQFQPIDLPIGGGRYVTVAFSPDGRWLATASSNHSWSLGGDYTISSDDNTIRLWSLANIDSREAPFVLRGHDTSVQAVAFSPDSRSLVSVDLYANVRLWQVEPSQNLPYLFNGYENLVQASSHLLTGHENHVIKTAFSPDGRYLASASWDGSIRLWQTADFSQAPTVLTIGDNSIFDIAFSRDGRYLAAAGQDNRAHLWTVAQLDKAPLVLPGNSDGEINVYDKVVFSPDGQWLAYANDDTVRMWQVNRWASSPVVIAESSPPLAFTPDGSQLAAVGKDGAVRLWSTKDPQAGPIVLRVAELKYYAKDIEVGPDGVWLAASTLDDDKLGIRIGDNLRLWQLAEPNRAPVDLGTTGETEGFGQVAFSPDSRWLAVTRLAGLLTNETYLWSLADLGRAPLVLPDSGGRLTFSPDGQLLVMSYGDEAGTAHLWRFDKTATNPVVRSVFLRGHRAEINDMAFSPDSQQLATPSQDHTVRVWDLAQDRLIAVACRTTGRNLTAAEWQSYFPGEPYHKSCAQWPVHPTVTDQYLQRARELVASGEITGAIREYEQVLALEPTLGIIPEDEVNREAAAYLVEQAISLRQQGKLTEAMAALADARTKDPAVKISAETWNEICWQGGLNGMAADVLPACEQAVALEPESGNIRDSRGLVRALTGDLQGAIADFEFAIQQWRTSQSQETLIKQREQWIATLETGINPIDEATLAELRAQ